MYNVYFLKSIKNNKIYTGVTSKEVAQRLYEHNHHSNKFTKENGPYILLFFESYHCSKDAYLRERFYKSGLGRQIRNIIIKYMESIKDL